jgi:DNA polymerase-3 subunit beta
MRLIEGAFPDYRQVIPKQGEKAVKLELAKGNLRIAAQNPDLGEAREDVPVAYDGEPLKIGFNAKYLIDVLTVLHDADVRLELADDLSPGVVRPAGEAAAHFTAVIMPMRI